jgi:hypothetical protein
MNCACYNSQITIIVIIVTGLVKKKKSSLFRTHYKNRQPELVMLLNMSIKRPQRIRVTVGILQSMRHKRGLGTLSYKPGGKC